MPLLCLPFLSFLYCLILYRFLCFIRLPGQGFWTGLSLSCCTISLCRPARQHKILVSSVDFNIPCITCTCPGVWTLIEPVKTSCVYNKHIICVALQARPKFCLHDLCLTPSFHCLPFCEPLNVSLAELVFLVYVVHCITVENKAGRSFERSWGR